MRSVNLFPKIVKLFAACLLCLITINGLAQDKTKTIGNKPREGSTNNSFSAYKGRQVGIEMNAGRKPVQLLRLNFHVSNHSSDSALFKVNVYQMNGKFPADSNLVRDEIKGIIQHSATYEHHLVSIDLSPYNIKVKGDIVVSIEFLNTAQGAEIGFACGLFNGGTYHKDSETGPWKKIPIVGADFNVLVKKLK